MTIDMIAFDADDTLWHNEILYQQTQDRLAQLLADYADEQTVSQRLYQTETKNLEDYGYGIKSFTLSMIETAIELSQGQIRGSAVQTIIQLGRTMVRTEVELLAHTQETIRRLAPAYALMVITKGDLLDQERKLARSGLDDYFRHVEVVSEKNRSAYQTLLTRHGLAAERFVMVGNSLKSDILPVLALGGWAVYIPAQLTWAHEHVEAEHNGYYQLDHMGQLPELLEQLKHQIG